MSRSDDETLVHVHGGLRISPKRVKSTKGESIMNIVSHYAPNQTVIDTGDAVWLQSYESIVARYDKERNIVHLGCDWDYSKTTMKYVKKFIIQCSGTKSTHSWPISELRRALVTGAFMFGIGVHFEGCLQDRYERL